MIEITKPEDELDRLAALDALGKLDTPAEERYDRLTRKVAELLRVPIAYLALIDADRQWLKSSIGPLQCDLARPQSFCTHTILRPEPLIVRDARLDPRFADNPLVTTDPKIRFYAGIPLAGPGGHRVGTFCVADLEPRDLSAAELAILERFAAIVERKLNERPKVFLSYSHLDEEWKDRLLTHLSVLEEQRLLELWEDRRIAAGGEWADEIQEAMEASDVAVLLVSANYLTSRFILDVEIPRLLQRRDREGIEIFPIIVKPCLWGRVDWLARLNLRPRDARPLTGESEGQIEALLSALSGEILGSSRIPRALPPSAPPRPRPTPEAVVEAHPPEPAATEAVPEPAAAAAAEPSPAPAAAPGTPAADIASIIVLPFADLSADRDQEHLCDGVVDELINALTPIAGLRVASQISTFQFKSTAVDLDQLGRRTKVGAAIQGSVRRAADRLRISVRMVQLDGGFNLWSQRFEGSIEDLWGLQDEVAAGVAAALRGDPRAAGRAAAGPRETADLAAYELYLKGRHQWNRRTEASLAKSLQHFREAISREPRYGRAHAGLALAFITLSNYGALAPEDAMPAARQAAMAALAIDPTLAEVHCCLGVIEALYEHDWAQAEECFGRALAASPEDAGVRHWYAVNFLVPAGRFDEARGELARVLELDPLCLAARTSVGIQLYFEGRFEEAVARFEEVLELESGFPMAHFFLGQTLSELGSYEDAVRHLETAIERSEGGSPEMKAALGYALGRAGDAPRAQELLLELSDLAGERYVSPSLRAQILVGLGDLTSALGWLESAAEVRASDLAWLRLRPVFRPLRAEPRFQALVARLRLPAGDPPGPPSPGSHEPASSSTTTATS
ncbi:MAG TPA: tetratricopeptide repeat protein [Thermoanaerobaculia bacterium]|nr:tetratricopeptide repeat protein [Thermoanaerobaculia bacterium]